MLMDASLWATAIGFIVVLLVILIVWIEGARERKGEK